MKSRTEQGSPPGYNTPHLSPPPGRCQHQQVTDNAGQGHLRPGRDGEGEDGGCIWEGAGEFGGNLTPTPCPSIPEAKPKAEEGRVHPLP